MLSWCLISCLTPTAPIKHLKAETKSLGQERIASEKHKQTATKQILELTAAAQSLEQEVTRLNQQLSEATDTASGEHEGFPSLYPW